MSDDRPADHATLVETLDQVSGDWGYEDPIYRFWHQSFKAYHLVQGATLAMVAALRAVSPGGGALHPWFEEIVRAGTGLRFEAEHNRRWLEVTRPMLEAFWHSRFFLEMAVKYGQELDEAPVPSPLRVGRAPLPLRASIVTTPLTLV